MNSASPAAATAWRCAPDRFHPAGAGAANAASGKPYQIEISIGCARLEPDIATVHDLIDKADQEMYHLKTRKRGTAPAEKQD